MGRLTGFLWLLAVITVGYYAVQYSKPTNAQLAGSSLWFLIPQLSAPAAYDEGEAWVFDGVDERISIPYNAAQNVTDRFSIEVLGSFNATTTFHSIFERRNSVSAAYMFQMYLRSPDQHYTFQVQDSRLGDAGLKRYRYTVAVDDGVKRQYGVTFNTGDLKLYVNGAETTVAKDTDNAWISPLPAFSTDGYTIAANNVGSGYINGSIGRVTFYGNRVLSAGDFAELWNAGTPTDPTTSHGAYTTGSITASYLMETGDSTSASGVLDSSGNAMHGSTVNMESGDLQSW